MKNALRTSVATFALLAVIGIGYPAPAFATTDEGGFRTAKIASGDDITGREVSAYTAPIAGTTSFTVSETIHYLHHHSLLNWFGHDTAYQIKTQSTARFVPELAQWMLKDAEGAFISFHNGDKIGVEIAKPVLGLGTRSSPISGRDASSVDSVQTGELSSSGQTRQLIFHTGYRHVETWFDQTYSIDTSVTATWVPEQSAHMAWYGQRLYTVRLGSDDVRWLYSKPVVDMGKRFFQIDQWNDRRFDLRIVPFDLTDGNRNVLVNVDTVYHNDGQFQIKEYYIERTEVARYNDRLGAWTVQVDGRLYAVAFGDDVVRDDSAVVIRAPGNLHRPDVIVVNPGHSDEPPVVVPRKPGGPVINTPADNGDEPPVLVPAKPHHPQRKGPVVVTPSDDDDGPAVLVPRK